MELSKKIPEIPVICVAKKTILTLAVLCCIVLMTGCKSVNSDSPENGIEEASADSPAWDAIYSYSDSVRHFLRVRTENDTLFYDYSIAMDDMLNPVCFVGQAILKDGDSEIDEDENGVAYQVDEYVSVGKEYLAFRFDADSHKRVRIVMDDETAAKCNVSMPIILFPHEIITP